MAKLWYCVMTKHNQENVAQENLERQNFWTLFPKYLATTNEYTGQQLKQPILKHAFPGYGFVCFDVEADPWRKIWSTHGVKQLMSWSPASPARVPTRIIRELRGIYSPAHDYKSGQLLKIVRGKHAVRSASCSGRMKSVCSYS